MARSQGTLVKSGEHAPLLSLEEVWKLYLNQNLSHGIDLDSDPSDTRRATNAEPLSKEPLPHAWP